MSKDRLLSDEELQVEYLNMFRGGLEPLAKALGSQEEHFDELVKALAKGASAIANTQKRLYAESVIDNVIEDVAGYQAMSNRATVTVKELMNPDAGFRAYAKDLAEQRARIK